MPVTRAGLAGGGKRAVVEKGTEVVSLEGDSYRLKDRDLGRALADDTE
ncbi:MAG: hypothetical protein ACRDWA_01855 [Acidimicrobiia bacterium]